METPTNLIIVMETALIIKTEMAINNNNPNKRKLLRNLKMRL